MGEGRTNRAISHDLYLSGKTVEAHVRQIFQKLGLQRSPDDHRRVLAVLALLRRLIQGKPSCRRRPAAARISVLRGSRL